MNLELEKNRPIGSISHNAKHQRSFSGQENK